MFFSLTAKSSPSAVFLPRVSSILFKSVRDFILLEAVICRLLILPKNFLWSSSNTLPSTLRPQKALADFTANSTLRVTVLSIAVNTPSWTLLSTVVITLSTSLGTLLTKFPLIVCAYLLMPLFDL